MTSRGDPNCRANSTVSHSSINRQPPRVLRQSSIWVLCFIAFSLCDFGKDRSLFMHAKKKLSQKLLKRPHNQIDLPVSPQAFIHCRPPFQPVDTLPIWRKRTIFCHKCLLSCGQPDYNLFPKFTVATPAPVSGSG